MIPKLIHYCWFGGELSPLGTACMETWIDKNPGYKIMLWNESNIPTANPYIEHAISTKQWAFLSDYVRLWAVYEYGGFYCDTDVEAIKSFDFLVGMERVFSGWESEDYINFSFFGAPKGDPLLKEALSELVSRFERTGHFLSIPKVLTNLFISEHKKDDRIHLFAQDYFYPYNPYARNSLKVMLYRDITDNTTVIHHWDSSWVKKGFLSKANKALQRIGFIIRNSVFRF